MTEDYNHRCSVSSVFVAPHSLQPIFAGFAVDSPASEADSCGNSAVRRPSSSEPQTVGQVLWALRNAKGWTRRQLATKADVTIPVIFDAEKDRRDNITRQTYEDLCRALGTTVAEVVTRTDPGVTLPPSILGVRKPKRRKGRAGVVSESDTAAPITLGETLQTPRASVDTPSSARGERTHLPDPTPAGPDSPGEDEMYRDPVIEAVDKALLELDPDERAIQGMRFVRSLQALRQSIRGPAKKALR